MFRYLLFCWSIGWVTVHSLHAYTFCAGSRQYLALVEHKDRILDQYYSEQIAQAEYLQNIVSELRSIWGDNLVAEFDPFLHQLQRDSPDVLESIFDQLDVFGQIVHDQNAEIRAHMREVLQKTDSFSVDGVLEYYQRLPSILKYPQVDSRAQISAADGVGASAQRYALGDNLFIKSDPAGIWAIEKDYQVASALHERYGGPRAHGLQRFQNPESGMWQVGLVMDRVNGVPLQRLIELKQAGADMPFEVNSKHLASLEEIHRRLAQNGEYFEAGDVNYGDFILTSDGKVYPLDNEVFSVTVDRGKTIPRDDGLFGPDGVTVSDKIAELID